MTSIFIDIYIIVYEMRSVCMPLSGSKFFHFHLVFGKTIYVSSYTLQVGIPPQENPGSATDICSNSFLLDLIKNHKTNLL